MEKNILTANKKYFIFLTLLLIILFSLIRLFKEKNINNDILSIDYILYDHSIKNQGIRRKNIFIPTREEQEWCINMIDKHRKLQKKYFTMPSGSYFEININYGNKMRSCKIGLSFFKRKKNRTYTEDEIKLLNYGQELLNFFNKKTDESWQIFFKIDQYEIDGWPVQKYNMEN